MLEPSHVEPKQTQRLLLIENQPLVRDAFAWMISWMIPVSHIKSTGSGREAVAFASGSPPDLVIMNYQLNDGMEGVELIRALKAVCPRARLMVLTSAEHAVRMRAITKAGADAVAGLSAPTELLLKMLRALPRKKTHKPLVYPADSLTTCGNEVSKDLPELSPRERQVLKLIASGMSVREISDHLAISRKTVESHRYNIRSKLNIPTIDELRQLSRKHFGVVLPGESI